MRPNRPFLVGLVCWILILGGAGMGYKAMRQLGSAGFLASMQLFPYPAPVAVTILFGTFVVMIVTGICIYEEQGWARYVYIVLVIPGLIQGYLNIANAGKPDLARHIWEGTLVLYLLSIVILFLPFTKRYFHPPMYVDE